MTIKHFKINGMHCASCAATIKKQIESIPDVESANVNFATEKVTVNYDEHKVGAHEMNEKISPYGYSILDELDTNNPHSNHGEAPKDSELNILRGKTHFIVPVAVLYFLIMMWEILAKSFSFIPNIAIPMNYYDAISFVIATVSLFWIGKPYIRGVQTFARTGVANMDTLVGIGTGVAYVFSSILFLFPSITNLINVPDYKYFDVTIIVIGFITLGKFLEAKSKKKAGDAIEGLLMLQAKSARVIRDGIEIDVEIEKVLHNDVVVIKPGDRIPVDGIVARGSSYVDESMITGEPMAVSKNEGDKVFAGTINDSGYIEFLVTKVGEETTLSQITKMVENAFGSKAKIEALTDKISSVFVPSVVVVSVVTLILWLTVGIYFYGASSAVSLAVLSFVNILVIACPCALGLATPTAIIVGVGKGAKNGILIKDANAIEILSKVDTLVIDKTGTLTKGHPTITDIINVGTEDEESIIKILASLESRSEHPIAKAIAEYAKEKNIQTLPLQFFENIKGFGVSGIVNDTKYYAGNISLSKEKDPTFDTSLINKYLEQGKTPIILIKENIVVAVVFVSDEIKENAKEAVLKLKKMGIRVIVSSGDNEKPVKYISDLVGINEVYAGSLPKDKLDLINKLKQEGRMVAMAGDGINDSPALAASDVGIAMSNGADIAIESASLTILHGDINKIEKAVIIARQTMSGVKQNLFWAFFYNIIGIPIATGIFYPAFNLILNPVFSGMAMAFSSVSVVINSLRIKSKKI